jgi:RHS repeat-associated protein
MGRADGTFGTWSHGYGKADEFLSLNDGETASIFDAAGPSGRSTSRSVLGDQGMPELFGYDSVGHRTSDSRCEYTWSWRGELVKAKVIDPDDQDVGRWVEYRYDATGRLLSRTEFNAQGDFVAKRGFFWNGWERLGEIGLSHLDEELWQSEFLPGPGGLDSSPQVRVTTGLGPDPTTPVQTRTYGLIRDAMGSVMAVVEDRDIAVDEAVPLLARYHYTPFGEAHVELGPEILAIEHDPEWTELSGILQDPIDPAEPTAIAGAIVITTTLVLDGATFDDGVVLQVWNEEDGAWDTLVLVGELGQDEASDPPRLVIMPKGAWQAGMRYRVNLTTSLTDRFSRPILPPGGGTDGFQFSVEVPASVTDATAELPGLPLRFRPTFDSVAAASTRFGDDDQEDWRFPGGQNLLFQGLWADSVTGMSYARNRWYDAKNGSWLSEDPAGAFDSENLYAFVGWQPHLYSDPTGEMAFLPVLGYMAISAAVSVAIGASFETAQTIYAEDEWGYGWSDVGIDAGLGALTFGLNKFAHIRHLRHLGRGRAALRIGGEVGLDIGAEALRNGIQGRDASFGQAAFGAVLNFGIGEGGAAIAGAIARNIRFRNPFHRNVNIVEFLRTRDLDAIEQLPQAAFGHVGISFGSRKIFGFGPTGPGINARDLLARKSYPGKVTTDTEIFDTAEMLGLAVNRTPFEVSLTRYWKARASLFVDKLGGRLSRKRYSFPPKRCSGFGWGKNCYNCATYPTSIGLPTTHPTGYLSE